MFLYFALILIINYWENKYIFNLFQKLFYCLFMFEGYKSSIFKGWRVSTVVKIPDLSDVSEDPGFKY